MGTADPRDGLTGLFNRRSFDDAFIAEWERSVRHGHPLSVIMIDLDYFKFYNDNYGHLKGDDCLKAVANALEKALQRSTDFVARFGGEEFSAILPETPAEEAVQAAEKIRKTVLELDLEHLYSSAAEKVTVSVGVASAFPRFNVEYRELLELADRALYKAKEAGRNRVEVEVVKEPAP